MNRVFLIGNLGRDPEIRTLEGDRKVGNFPLATSESFVSKSGERVTQTEWHDIEVWDGLARLAEVALRKGSKVFVEGRIRTDQWKDKEGKDQRTKRIRAINIELLTPRDPATKDSSSPDFNHRPSNDSSHETNAPIQDTAEDDLPF